jgi:hypothetical protein
VTMEVLGHTSLLDTEKTRCHDPVGGGGSPLSLTVVEKEERDSLRAPWSSSGVANDKSVTSGCAYGWVETGTPFSSRFTNSSFMISIFILCVLK